MSADDFGAAELSDDWIERDGEQPPTLKISIHGSLSGSVNILGDRTQKWTNVDHMVSRDLLTKQTKPLTSLFEPPPKPIESDFEQDIVCEGLSVVEEEFSGDDQGPRMHGECPETWDVPASARSISPRLESSEDKENSDMGTLRAIAPRSVDGLIPNFSFPRTNSNGMLGNEMSSQASTREAAAHQSKAAANHSSMPLSRSDAEVTRRVSNTMCESDVNSTPRRHTPEPANHSVSPTKSPLKLFHTDQDTFTRDHTARMIGMLSAAPAPIMQTIQPQQNNDTQKSHQSNISAMSEMTDSGPERKKARKHEPKGSVTLQNFNDNADRLAAKLRAKGGGLGKGLPRLLDDNKVILGRRISSSNFDQLRKKERSNKYADEPQNSGFEAIDIPVDRFPKDPKFGTASMKSHFSDWNSECNTESRQVSCAVGTELDDELAAQSIKPQKMYDSIRQTWTQSSGRIMTNDRPSTAPSQNSPHQHVRSCSSSSNVDAVSSPRIKNFPPSSMESLRHGDMVFSKSRQCWIRVDENEEDPFSGIEDMNSYSSSGTDLTLRDGREARNEYPDEIELSSSSEHRSEVGKDEKVDRRCRGQSGKPVSDATLHGVLSIQDTASEQEVSPGTRDRSSLQGSLSPAREEYQRTQDEQDDQEIVELTANMTMSQSTNFLVSAINKRYGEGPWESVRKIDLSNLQLDTLVGLSRLFPNLIWLDVSGNQLTSLNDLPETLQVLRAGNNHISSHRVSFAHLRNLETLELDNNQMEDLDSLRPLIHLRHLSLNANALTCINGLSSLTNLITLAAEGNMLTQVDFYDLQAQSSLALLERIDLSHNRLTTLTGIDHLENLLELDIRSNSLREFDVSHGLPRLKVLKASDNEIRHFELALVPNIRILYLDDNEISSLTAAHTHRYIESIALRRQRVDHIEIDLDNICDIRKLFLGGNNMKGFNLPTPFHSMKYLEIAGTQIDSLAPNFAELAPNLRVLNLSNNELSDITPLSGLSRLERLMLPNNSLTSAEEIAGVLCCLPRLKALDLRANACTRRYYAPITANQDIDYFANFDGVRNSENISHRWQVEDSKYFATLSNSLRKRREAYQNFIWTVCRALRWHDGRVLELQQLLLADEYVEGFTQESLLVTE